MTLIDNENIAVFISNETTGNCCLIMNIIWCFYLWLRWRVSGLLSVKFVLYHIQFVLANIHILSNFYDILLIETQSSLAYKVIGHVKSIVKIPNLKLGAASALIASLGAKITRKRSSILGSC